MALGIKQNRNDRTPSHLQHAYVYDMHIRSWYSANTIVAQAKRIPNRVSPWTLPDIYAAVGGEGKGEKRG